ncbi:hypothetical protein [Persephonella sp.]
MIIIKHKHCKNFLIKIYGKGESQIKKTAIILGISGTLALSGLAQAGTLSNADRDFLFGSQSVQAKTISVEEMKNTNGEFLPVLGSVALWTIGGAITGGLTSYLATGEVSWRDIGAGATAGFYASPIMRPIHPVIRFGMGMAGTKAWYNEIFER